MLCVALWCACTLPLVSCSSGGSDESDKTTLAARLTGQDVAPGPGDEDGTGEITITLGEQPGTICYAYSTKFVDQATGIKLGNGNPGDFGATLVSLATGPQGSPDGCATGIDEAVIRGIKLAPESYYAEIDTSSFPEGAVRGQFQPSQ